MIYLPLILVATTLLDALAFMLLRDRWSSSKISARLQGIFVQGIASAVALAAAHLYK